MDITLGKMASWIFGVLFILAGLGGLLTNPIAGVIYFLTGIFLIPNVRQKIDEEYDVAFSRWVVVLIAVIGMGLGGAFMQDDVDSTTTPTADNGNNQESAQSTDNQEEQANTDNQDQQTDNQEDSSEDKIDSTGQDTLSKEERTHEVGSEFTVGDVRYQVNGVTTRQEIGERTAGTLIGVEANGKFLIVDTTVMNEANEAIRMRESSLKLMIDEAEYSPSSEAWVYMDESFTFEQLNPGVQVDGDVAYDVPESASTDTMELQVSPVGLFSTEEPHYVELSS